MEDISHSQSSVPEIHVLEVIVDRASTVAIRLRRQQVNVSCNYCVGFGTTWRFDGRGASQ